MSAIDLAAFDASPLRREPFEYVVVPGFVRSAAVAAICADYPRIEQPGSFPISEIAYGPAFAAFLGEFQGADVRHAFERKFGVDLSDRPLMATVRGRCRKKDGRIHTDTGFKIITVLIYMNRGWDGDRGGGGGRLRLLRSADDLEDFAEEVAPVGGTLLAFRRSDRSFHGHKPFVGERRVIQFNWVRDESVVRRELARHRFSARLKRLNPFA